MPLRLDVDVDAAAKVKVGSVTLPATFLVSNGASRFALENGKEISWCTDKAAHDEKTCGWAHLLPGAVRLEASVDASPGRSVLVDTRDLCSNAATRYLAEPRNAGRAGRLCTSRGSHPINECKFIHPAAPGGSLPEQWVAVDGDTCHLSQLERNEAVKHLLDNPRHKGRWCTNRGSHDVAACTFLHPRPGTPAVHPPAATAARPTVAEFQPVDGETELPPERHIGGRPLRFDQLLDNAGRKALWRALAGPDSEMKLRLPKFCITPECTAPSRCKCLHLVSGERLFVVAKQVLNLNDVQEMFVSNPGYQTLLVDRRHRRCIKVEKHDEEICDFLHVVTDSEDAVKMLTTTIRDIPEVKELAARAGSDTGALVFNDFLTSHRFNNLQSGVGAETPVLRQFAAGVAQQSGHGPETVSKTIQLKPVLHAAEYVHLYHGTKDPTAVLGIFQHGFDPARRSGQVYGPGEYFDQTVSVAKSYVGTTGLCIVVAVLKGTWMSEHVYKGNSSRKINVVDNLKNRSSTYCLPLCAIGAKSICDNVQQQMSRKLNPTSEAETPSRVAHEVPANGLRASLLQCRLISPSVQSVQFRVKGEVWQSYASHDSAAVLVAKNKGERGLTRTMDGFEYEIDFHSMKQKNTKTSTVRDIRLVGTN